VKYWYGLEMLDRLGQPTQRIRPDNGSLLSADRRDRD
jgi:hypothetical protein